MMGTHRGNKGFTLVEIVVTIIIAGILSTVVVSYIADSVEGFSETSSRNRLSSAGRTVLDRIALELQNALPNSMRVDTASPAGDQCLEFIPFRRATTYIDPSFSGSGSSRFDAVDFNPSLTLASPAGVYAVVYPDDTAELYQRPSPGPVALVDEIVDPDGSDGRVTINLDQSHRFSRRSPVERMYIAGEPVSFCIDGGDVYRYSNYGYQASQPEPEPGGGLPANGPVRQLVSDQVDNSGITAFSVLEPTLRRNAIIHLDFRFTARGDVVRLNHEVQMRNVP